MIGYDRFNSLSHINCKTSIFLFSYLYFLWTYFMQKIASITSTIKPDPNVFLLKRTSVEDRLSDYETCFKFYCGLIKDGSFDNIVYVDNSGYPLSSLEKIATDLLVRDKVEFISYLSKDSPMNSRYFLEVNLIQYGMKNSDLIQNSENPMIWKITGRYLIKNISKIIGNLDKNYNIHINFRNKPYKILDFYLVGFNKKGFEILVQNLDSYEGIVDGEIILRNHLETLDQNKLKINSRFKAIPRVIGVRGHDNKSYNNFISDSKYLLRVLSNWIFPNRWI